MATRETTSAEVPMIDRMGDALITAQSMEDAIRTIIEPLADCDGKAFPILCAVEACLDKIKAEVDPLIDEYQAAQQREEVSHA